MAQQGNRYTLAELVKMVSEDIDDPSFSRWQESEVERAIKRAVREAQGYWFEERTYEAGAYTAVTTRYKIPTYAVNVLEVWLDSPTAGEPRYLVPTRFWRREGNELVFLENFATYGGEDMHVIYTAHASNLLDIRAADGVTTDNVLTSVTSLFKTKGVRVGDEVVISAGSAAVNGTYYVEEVSTETSLRLDRDPGANEFALTFEVAYHTDVPIGYLGYFAMAYLYELAGRNRPGVEVEQIQSWASYYRQLADLELRKNGRRMRQVRRV